MTASLRHSGPITPARRLRASAAFIAFAIAILLTALPAIASDAKKDQGAPKYGAPREQMETVLNAFRHGSPADEMEALLRRNPFASDEMTQQGRDTVQRIQDSLLLYLDHEHVCSETLTDRLVLVTFVAHFERQPVLVRAQFYDMADQTWVVQSWDFSVDTAKMADAIRAARERSEKE